MCVARLVTLLPLLSIAAASGCVLGRRVLVPRDAVDGLWPLTHVTDVRNSTECFALCLREGRCIGSMLDSGLCRLITARRHHERSQSGPPVEVWFRGQTPARCPADFALARNHSRYKVVTNQIVTRDQARKACERAGGKLLELLDIEEMEFFRPILEKTNEFWIGAYQLPTAKGKADDWFWERSGTQMAANLWHSSQPNDSGGNQVVSSLYYSGKTAYGVNDMQGSDFEKYPYICECIAFE